MHLTGIAVLLIALTLTLLWREGEGHGRLLVPPARHTMWREGFNTPKDYTDHGLNCGGMYHQQSLGGKCGLCGDPYDTPKPRERENGGKYGLGVIARTYKQGQTIDVKVELTAAHKGYFEFRLCPLVDRTKPATQECLDKNLLQMTDGSTRYLAGNVAIIHDIRVVLPQNVTCEQCVFQWRYHAGNSWGTDAEGTGIGHGAQEEFYGCSDVTIKPSDGNSQVTREARETTPEIPAATKKTKTAVKYECLFKENPYGSEELDDLCQCECDEETGVCSNAMCHCRPRCTRYEASGVYAGQADMDFFCEMSCHGRAAVCPLNICACVNDGIKRVTCRGFGKLEFVSGYARYCEMQCNARGNLCPPNCICD